MQSQQNGTYFDSCSSFPFNHSFLSIIVFVSSIIFALSPLKGKDIQPSDSELIEIFINSKGSKNAIVFDASNIKQFWIDKSVASGNDLINISLQEKKSIPLKIQLSNVIETMDCKVDVITENPDISFTVENSNSKTLSNSSKEEDFIQYHISSATFHLENTKDFSFHLIFSSKTSDTLTIKKIILSFSENKESLFLGSPGFELLKKQIEEDGTVVPNSEIKYLISKEHRKIFIMVPDRLVTSYPFFYHVFPVDESNLSRGREPHGFNNMDFSVTTSTPNSVVIPKPYLANSDFTIIQKTLPVYQCTRIQFGQFDPAPPYKQRWAFEIKNW